jgi:hypothetical protein
MARRRVPEPVAAPDRHAEASARRTRMTLHDFDLFQGHIKWRDSVPVYVYEYPSGKVREGQAAEDFVADLNARCAGRNYPPDN